MKYIVKIIPSQCIGAASCVALAPQTFQMNDENIAELVSEDDDSPEAILSAAQSCPVNAIEIYEKNEDGTEGKKVWPPV